MIDPRIAVVEKRLAGTRRILAYCSAKGGVGKTLCASLSALLLARAGRRTGLLDLDFQGASAHIVLGSPVGLPREKEGILPLAAPYGLSLMTVAAFTGERALPLRGNAVTDAILELLAVTQWGELDVLVVDMPPGIGEEVLDLVTLVPRMEAVVVSTPAVISLAVVDRLLAVFGEMKVKVAGVIANMSGTGSTGGEARARGVAVMASRRGVPFAGEVPMDPGIEAAIGDADALCACKAAEALEMTLAALERSGG